MSKMPIAKIDWTRIAMSLKSAKYFLQEAPYYVSYKYMSFLYPQDMQDYSNQTSILDLTYVILVYTPPLCQNKNRPRNSV